MFFQSTIVRTFFIITSDFPRKTGKTYRNSTFPESPVRRHFRECPGMRMKMSKVLPQINKFNSTKEILVNKKVIIFQMSDFFTYPYSTVRTAYVFSSYWPKIGQLFLKSARYVPFSSDGNTRITHPDPLNSNQRNHTQARADKRNPIIDKPPITGKSRSRSV